MDTVSHDTRARLREALDRLDVPIPDLTAWLCGLPPVPTSALPPTDLQHALERLANARDTGRLLGEWRASRAVPESGVDFGALIGL